MRVEATASWPEAAVLTSMRRSAGTQTSKAPIVHGSDNAIFTEPHSNDATWRKLGSSRAGWPERSSRARLSTGLDDRP
jgi:hypothetical protein